MLKSEPLAMSVSMDAFDAVTMEESGDAMPKMASASSAKSAGTGAGGSPPPQPGESRHNAATDSDTRSRMPIVFRTNLRETAVFASNVTTSKGTGIATLNFTAPEALTTWKIIVFAHNKALAAGVLADTATTTKALMVQPNAPRFLREGDEIEFPAKVSSTIDEPQAGTAELKFAGLGESGRAHLLQSGIGSLEDTDFNISGRGSATVRWTLRLPKTQRRTPAELLFNVGARSTFATDGEQGRIPVLSNRVVVTESLPLAIRRKGTSRFTFTKLLASGSDLDLEHKKVVVQMTSNPEWYAIAALPSLIAEDSVEPADRTFHRLYAAQLALRLGKTNPEILQIVNQWQAAPPPPRRTEKLQDDEQFNEAQSPWATQLAEESKSRQAAGNNWDQPMLAAKLQSAQDVLQTTMLPGGGWSWFPDSHFGILANLETTLTIIVGFGRLKRIGIEPAFPLDATLQYLDAELKQWYDGLFDDHGVLRSDPVTVSPSTTLHLYAMSFFVDPALSSSTKLAVQLKERMAQHVAFSLDHAARQWTSMPIRTQAQLAVTLKRYGNAAVAEQIVASLKEKSVTDEELGMHWPSLVHDSWAWCDAPVGTQVSLIEAFDEVAADRTAVDECKVWLLKQKQTTSWKTESATADAIYALWSHDTSIPRPDGKTVEITMGGALVIPSQQEAGTGYFETELLPRPELGEIAVTSSADGVAWGNVFWQYVQDIAKVTPHHTALGITKTIHVKTSTPLGPTLVAAGGTHVAAVGDELVVRLVIRNDRAMSFARVRDERGAGCEPVQVISGYRFQEGTSYYQSTGDIATDFFFDFLPKGTFVIEYSLKIQLRGRYESGVGSITSMYAPEFTSHSDSISLSVD